MSWHPEALSEFLELTPRERIAALLDAQVPQVELLGPFDRVASPWLGGGGLVAQSDDGVVIVRGSIEAREVVMIAIEPAFEGGSIGEVGGAKIACALQLAAESCRAGRPVAAVMLPETGGVRLSEANLGLAAIAEIQRGILELRELAPVVTVIAGPVGCFGGMSLAAALSTHIIGTRYGRYGMNGPEVIEQEAGPDELEAGDREEVWAVYGCEARLRQGWIDALVAANREEIGAAVRAALSGEMATRPRVDAARWLAGVRREVAVAAIA
jgi:malonate decarboxylase beta subunit